jgi:UDP-N-acetylglucosamine diphosphorylase / glucose-1-phosphate thymidylyltransferase / UDP-N-acetylgalactosamine diphosphorylase / glucosamine-1-phosphate N-acetyltransferase / galactosamine-1-phosphate N-acetyltransferase
MKLNIILLAGGLSKRFWPLEEKNLITFFGIPLVIYQIRRYTHFFRKKGVEVRFFVITNEANYLQISNLIKTHKLKRVSTIIQKLPDQSGAIIAALEKISNTNPTLVVNSNDIFSEKTIVDLQNSTKDNAIVLSATPVKSYVPGGYLKVDKKTKQVEQIWEKPPEDEVPSNLNLFRFVFDYFRNSSVLKKVLIKKNLSITYEDAINSLLQTEKSAYVISTDDFATLKYPWHILDAMSLFLKNINSRTINSTETDPTANIIGNVYIEENVKIGSFVKISGPVFIGKNTIIGDHVLIRDSHIGKDCIIGAHSEVARSYLANNVMLHRNYVGDSVIDTGCSLGANTVTANWRFDQQPIYSYSEEIRVNTNRVKLGAIIGANSKIGVGVNLMPGTKIGKESLIMPGSILFPNEKNGKT